MKERGRSIGAAAKASGVSIKAIRYYEDIGLIPRTLRRANGGQGAGHRVFTDADVGRLRFIHHVLALGLGLAEIRDLAAIAEEQGCPGNRPQYRQILARHLDTVNGRIEHLLRLRRTLESLMDPECSPANSRCTWETCDCMDPSPAEPDRDKSVLRESSSH